MFAPQLASTGLLLLKPTSDLSQPAFNKLTASYIKESTPELINKHAALIIVTDNPFGTQSIIRKHWHRLIRKVEIERASTLDLTKRSLLEQQIESMNNLPFTINCPAADDWGIFFMQPSDMWKAYKVLGLDREEGDWLPSNG